MLSWCCQYLHFSSALIYWEQKRNSESLCLLTVMNSILVEEMSALPTGKVAVPLTKISEFSALMLLGFNIYPRLLAETCAKRHSTDETEALNLSNSLFQVQRLGQRLKWDQEPRAERPGAMYWAHTSAAIVPNLYCCPRKSHAPAFAAKGEAGRIVCLTGELLQKRVRKLLVA